MRRRALTLACVAIVAPVAVAAPAERPSVVAVRAWTAAGVAERATGIVVSAGRVLTVDHVLRGADRVEVRDGAGTYRAGTVLRRRPALDLALLRVPGASGPPPRFGDAGSELRVLLRRDGEVRPRPAGLRRRLVARLVDQPGRPRRRSLELGVRVAAGDSGAPVVDRGGRVVGVVYARSTRRDGTAYAVRGDALRHVVR